MQRLRRSPGCRSRLTAKPIEIRRSIAACELGAVTHEPSAAAEHQQKALRRHRQADVGETALAQRGERRHVGTARLRPIEPSGQVEAARERAQGAAPGRWTAPGRSIRRAPARREVRERRSQRQRGAKQQARKLPGRS